VISSGNENVKVDTNLEYNPSSNVLTVGNITAIGNISIGGTLTYEDVNNIDSVGLVTARSGIRVLVGGIEVSNGGASITGITTSTSFVKTGGTSSQFLKADGSVDTSTYLADISQDTTPQLGGTLDTNGNLIEFGDSGGTTDDRLHFGTDNDLEIYHNGTNSRIADRGTGNLQIISNSNIVLLHQDDESDNGAPIAKFFSDGANELYYNGTKKFETTTSGVTVTGTISDSIGPLRRLGQNIKSTAYTLVADDAGKHVRVDNGSTIIVPDNVFSSGDMITIVANSASDVPITQGTGLSLYNASDGTTGNKTLAARTVCTILISDGGSSTIAYISGGGLS